MRKLGATVQAPGDNANALIDGDPNTYWSAGEPPRGRGRSMTALRPHEVVIHFPKPVEMTGLALMPRQNDRDHQGDIRGYVIAVSDDGQSWREWSRGELASTWEPQELWFTKILTTRYLKFTSQSGFGADPSSALAELAVLYAGPKLADNIAAPVEYRRSKSTSTDIDEGAGSPPTTKPPRAKP
jgi:hypothetical protein